MSLLHPSETPPLGWLVPCLTVGDLQASLDFYARLGLMPYGGDQAAGWAMLRSRAIEVHLFQEHIPRDVLNFRGGDPGTIRAALSARGMVVHKDLGPASFIYQDPDGLEVFFDSSEEEQAGYVRGQILTALDVIGDVQAGDGPDLGDLEFGILCADVEATAAFYENLGLARAAGHTDGAQPAATLARPDCLPAPGKRLIDPILGLYDGAAGGPRLTFHGADVVAVTAAIGRDVDHSIKDALNVEDPDGRSVRFRSAPIVRG